MIIELKVEKSRIRPGEPVDDNESAEFPSTTDQLSIQLTLKIATSKSAYVGGKVIVANGTPLLRYADLSRASFAMDHREAIELLIELVIVHPLRPQRGERDEPRPLAVWV